MDKITVKYSLVVFFLTKFHRFFFEIVFKSYVKSRSWKLARLAFARVNFNFWKTREITEIRSGRLWFWCKDMKFKSCNTQEKGEICVSSQTYQIALTKTLLSVMTFSKSNNFFVLFCIFVGVVRPSLALQLSKLSLSSFLIGTNNMHSPTTYLTCLPRVSCIITYLHVWFALTLE